MAAKNMQIAHNRTSRATTAAGSHSVNAAKTYRTMTSRRGGRGKRTVLATRYNDMRQRCRGAHTKAPELYAGMLCDFRTFHEFREFAIACGFSKRFDSPDRIDSAFGYHRWNIRFTDKLTNAIAPLRAINEKRRLVTGMALAVPSRFVTDFAEFDRVPF